MGVVPENGEWTMKPIKYDHELMGSMKKYDDKPRNIGKSKYDDKPRNIGKSKSTTFPVDPAVPS